MHLQSVTARTSWMTGYTGVSVYYDAGFFAEFCLCAECLQIRYTTSLGTHKLTPKNIYAFDKKLGPFPGRRAYRHTVTVLFFARNYRFLVPVGLPNHNIQNRVKK